MLALRAGCWALVVGATLAACGESSSDGEVNPGTVARAQLERWEARGITSYTYVVRRGCACEVSSLRVVVEDGDVESVVDEQTGLFVDEGQTLTELMQALVALARQNDESFSATYDADYGYAERVTGWKSDVSEEGYDLRVTCFAESTEDDACPVPTVDAAFCPGEAGPAREEASETGIKSCVGARPLGRLTGEEQVCCPGLAGRGCVELVQALASELEERRACTEDADCGWHSIPSVPDCVVPLGAEAELERAEQIQSAIAQQACEVTRTDELCGSEDQPPELVCLEGQCTPQASDPEAAP